jgi:serine/threonine protein kinase
MSSGTVHYMSPQQANGGPADPATDVYALGLVLLECLTGTKAFPGTHVESLVARTLRGPAIPQGLGPRWVSLLTAMTAMEAADRPSAAEASAGAAAMIQRPALPLRDFAAGLFAGNGKSAPRAPGRQPLSPAA